MDPFSVIVGVITLIDATKKAKDYLHAVKNGPKEKIRLIEELESIEVLIKGFEELSRKSKTDTLGTATSSMRRLTDLERNSSPLARSLEEVEKLTCKFEQVGCSKGSKWRAATQALDWPFSQKEVLSSLERLERMRTMLTAGLGIDHL
ncbi:MAG: hypothetical protein LQ337_006874 [Flavoplaca oasis]|nr:MAG: hypothetical protein LQ337_006874 [Flavoplaca oasis]